MPEKKFLILLVLEQLMQYFACVYIIMVIIAICYLTEKESLSLQLIMEMSTFQQSFGSTEPKEVSCVQCFNR